MISAEQWEKASVFDSNARMIDGIWIDANKPPSRVVHQHESFSRRYDMLESFLNGRRCCIGCIDEMECVLVF